MLINKAKTPTFFSDFMLPLRIKFVNKCCRGRSLTVEMD